MSASRLKALTAGVVTLLLSACALRGWIGGGEAIRVTEAGRAQLCSAEDDTSRVHIFDSPAAVIDWQERTGIRLAEFKDLERGRYALIEMGQRHTGGYGLAVSREARIVGNTLRLVATFFSPKAGSMRTQMITSPCVLVHLTEGDYVGVEVYDQNGELRAASQGAR
ncbi:protease complex subunit PrcB family protein [Sinimarinibacterium thermocellulolyticum]|uniref:Protease complex subunit PrcB family protein n=1 Tax=Sinimarinibacterium thermocellulolyticum TaxID=3170016 RepID=A0ABV2A5J3_9GAMM